MLYRAYLKEYGPPPGRRHGPLTAVTSIGRSQTCTIVISHDPSASKLHAEIRQTPDGDYVLEDRKSFNGTLIGGRRVAKHVLRHGETFTIGTTHFRFDLVPEGDVIISVPLGTTSPGTGLLSSHGGAMPSGTGLLSSQGSDSETRAVVIDDGETHSGAAVAASGDSGVFVPAAVITDAGQLRRDYEKLRIAHSILAAVGRPMRLEDTLGIIAKKAFDALPARRFAVLLVANDTGELVEKLVSGRDDVPPDAALRISRTLLDRVCRDATPLLSRDVREMSTVGKGSSLFGGAVRSIVAAPVVAGAELFGVLYADNSAEDLAFDEKDLHILATIANQLALALRNARLLGEVREETRRRTVLGRFLSPNLVNRVLEGDVSLSRRGEARPVAVLFTDIRGFTKIAERLKASEVTALLNEHFDCLVDVLFRAGGTLDKYIGDALMAFFGAPTAGPHDAETAVQCALDMQAAIVRLNAVRLARGIEPTEITIGIGIAYGEVSWGPVGSRDSMSYTVVGDVVNVASRLCGEAKPGEVLVTTAVRDRLPASLAAERLEKDTVKGKEGRVDIWRVHRV